MSGKQFLYIVIATLITVTIWVTLDILHSRNESKVAPDVQKLLEPVNPNFDQETINGLK